MGIYKRADQANRLVARGVLRDSDKLLRRNVAV